MFGIFGNPQQARPQSQHESALRIQRMNDLYYQSLQNSQIPMPQGPVGPVGRAGDEYKPPFALPNNIALESMIEERRK